MLLHYVIYFMEMSTRHLHKLDISSSTTRVTGLFYVTKTLHSCFNSRPRTYLKILEADRG